MLVETAFISNPSEETRLRSRKHQQKVANAIFKGVRRYFVSNPPVGTRLAKQSPRRHVVRRGDTLSHIAQRYGVSLSSLRNRNRLKGDRLLVGNVLKIPLQGG